MFYKILLKTTNDSKGLHEDIEAGLNSAKTLSNGAEMTIQAIF